MYVIAIFLYASFSNLYQHAFKNKQRVLIVTTYQQTDSLHQVRDKFERIFPERKPPTKLTILKTVNKHIAEGTVLNLNQKYSGRRITVRSAENTETLHELMEQQQQREMIQKLLACHFIEYEKMRNSIHI